MKLVADGIEWDEGNREKCQEHGLTIEEIEGILALDTLVLLPDPFPSEERQRAIARTASGRYAFIVFTMRHYEDEVLVRPISARYMHLKEARNYGE
jgi:uncharacterized protein